MSEMMQRFIGTWRLVSQQAYTSDGKITYPRGENALGLLMYDAAGNMMVQLARQGNLTGELSSFKTAMEDFLAYSGMYLIDQAAGVVIHAIEACSYPDWIGTEQVRKFEFEDDELILSAVGNNETRVLRWQKS